MPKIKMMRISLDVSLESLLSAAANEGTRLDMEPFYKDVPPLNGARVTHTEEVKALPKPEGKKRMRLAVIHLMRSQNGKANTKEIGQRLEAVGYSHLSMPNLLAIMWHEDHLIFRKAKGLYMLTKKGAAYNG